MKESKPDYSLSIRYDTDEGWTDWKDTGHGKYLDHQQIEAQAKILFNIKPESKAQVKFQKGNNIQILTYEPSKPL